MDGSRGVWLTTDMLVCSSIDPSILLRHHLGCWFPQQSLMLAVPRPLCTVLHSATILLAFSTNEELTQSWSWCMTSRAEDPKIQNAPTPATTSSVSRNDEMIPHIILFRNFCGQDDAKNSRYLLDAENIKLAIHRQCQSFHGKCGLHTTNVSED